MIVRVTSAALLSVALSGCYNGKMVVDRAWLEADLPVPPPAFVPDSSRKGDDFVQFGVRLSDKRTLETGREQRWDVAPFAAQAQMQHVISPRFRWVLGGSYSNSASLWTGPVMSVRNSILRWDIETILGCTWAKGGIEGHEYLKDDEGVSRTGASDTSLFNEPRLWGQASLRTRLVGTGPWLEAGILPSFRWGTLQGKVNPNTLDAKVESSIGVLGVGWIQELQGGSSVILGMRMAFVNDETQLPHYVIAVQKRLPR